MPTRRAWTFFILALVLYFLANQTQVGWVYVIAAGLVGLLVLAFIYSRGVLKPVRASRSTRNLAAAPSRPDLALANQAKNRERLAGSDFVLPTFHEDDPLEVTLRFNHRSLRPALLVHGLERCPFAPPADRDQSFFLPGLFKNRPVSLSYQIQAERRGLFTFPEIPLYSTGPFGLFRTKRKLTVAGEVLIYPAYHPLQRLRILENRGFSERHALRSGLSSDVIGTREYRSGDSLRQVHWRSTAHAGKLMVKEFADTDQLTMTVVLDLAAGRSLGQGKFSTFETAVRLAASFGFYATRHKIPFYLAGSNAYRKPPRTALSWWAILNYLARVEQAGQEPLSGVIDHLAGLPFMIVLASRPDEETVKALQGVARRGTQTLAILITPDGARPDFASSSKSAYLQIRGASPYNWVELLSEL